MPNKYQSALILFGLLGLAAGAFLWGNSAAYVALRQMLAEKLVDWDVIWPLEPVLPWFLLTNYPQLNDTMTPLDGVVLVIYMLGVAVAVSATAGLCLAAATRACGSWSWPRFHHFAQGLIPLAGCGVFLGLSSLTVTMLKAEGITSSLVARRGRCCWRERGCGRCGSAGASPRPRPSRVCAGLWRPCFSPAPRRWAARSGRACSGGFY